MSGKDLENLFAKFQGPKDSPYSFYAQEKTPREREENYKPLPHEQAIWREQQQTIFENNETMQKLFKGDFDEYCKALDDPDLMFEKIEKRMQESRQKLNEDPANNSRVYCEEFWIPQAGALDELGDFEDFGDWDGEADDLDEGEIIDLPEEAQDLLYEKAFQWSLRLHKIGHKIYDHQNRKDPDLFRVVINASMVSAKIAYASGDSFFGPDGPPQWNRDNAEYDDAGAELDMHGYTLAMAFLRRVRESLVNLLAKDFSPAKEWHRALSEADEIARELSSRMIDLTKRLGK